MLDIVIVNWNSGDQLRACIDSIAKYNCGLVCSVLVVDNGSVDGSEVMADGSLKVTLIRAGANLGFGKACNLGAHHAKGEYLLFLNPDAALYPETLSKVLAYMQGLVNKNVGICGVQLLDEAGHVSRSCARFPSVAVFAAQALGLNKLPWFRAWSQHMGEWAHDTTREVDQVIGAFFFIRRSVFEALNGFDERFFVYFEEVDVSYRARQAGWRSVYLASAQAFHAGGGTSQQVKAARLFYSLRSRLLYGFKHFSPLQAWALVGVTLLIEPVSRSIFSLLRGGLEDVRNTLMGYGMLWRALPAILRKNRQ